MVELPDDQNNSDEATQEEIDAATLAISGYSPRQFERWRHTSRGQQHHDRAVAALRAAAPLIAARVRAEAVAERAEIVDVIRQYLPDALPFNSLPAIVGGIARQRDFQRDIKDHLAAVARKLTDERDRAVAEAVAAEQQRMADWLEGQQLPEGGHHDFATANYNRGLIEAADELRAGSVPVATPEPLDYGTDPCGCRRNSAGDIRCHRCGQYVNKRCWNCKTPRGGGPCPNAAPGPVATPTEPGHDEQCEWEDDPSRGGCYCEARAYRLRMASPVPAEQPPTFDEQTDRACVECGFAPVTGHRCVDCGPDGSDCAEQPERRRCPVHGIPDCSPLLNGCNRLTAEQPEPVDEVVCPNCDTHIRARMSDASEPERKRLTGWFDVIDRPAEQAPEDMTANQRVAEGAIGNFAGHEHPND